ncbi:GDP-L-fucose synthase [Polaromonas sp. SM01]|uniref:GDP-L-fucose synthase n=1 Tax=Polaromonas sp. SM01 TaxID=3085630 RepID=UPI00298298B8|nr:GDP-L-fucose synthase [Polaromonas sp. SM01]MDW5443919.1 GDP-L-fucose synthase [Polaromonas sp. SM01]
MEHLNARIFVAGHRGMVGSAIVRLLKSRGYRNIVTRTHAELDLTDQAQVRLFFSSEKIEQVYLAAARVGGIHANNSYPANFIYENMMMQANIIHEAWRHDIRKLLFLGSSCIYPRLAAQPIREDSLMTGQLEPTNEAYAIAKIAGIKLCESYNRQHGTDYRSVMPTNLYGPGDNYHPENSHVIPGLIRRFHEAKIAKIEKVAIWGSGTPQREFLHVDDMALASLHVMDLEPARYEAATQPMQSHLNVGSGEELSIGELAKTVMQVVGFQGRIEFDNTKPDGTPRKLLDVSRLVSLGWAPGIPLRAGLEETYQAFLAGTQSVPSDGRA